MAENKVLKTHIINYSKTRDTYIAYRKSGYSKKFYEAHRDEILLHKAAKEAFSKLPGGKIPKVKDLNEEFARLLSKKKEAYSEYKKIKKEMREKENVITSMISHAISCEINKQIEAKEADLRILDSQLKSSVEERNSQLAKVNVSLERVGALLEKASDMYDEIDSIEIDCIADDIV